MKDWMKLALVAVMGISSFVVLLLGARRYMEQRRTTAEINRLRNDLYQARVTADRCRSSLATSEASLQTLGLTIDSLRTLVDSYEALGDGRVPGNQYEAYLEVFDSYNDSVASWEIRSQRLRAAETSCRAVIQEHNAITDSIQALLGDAGVEAP